MNFDVVIVGSGMVGTTLAAALGRAGLRVALLDRVDPSEMTLAPVDGRASAIAYGSHRALSEIGIWRHVSNNAQPIYGIRVSDGASPLFLHFDHRDLSEAPLGFMIENRHFRAGLFKEINDIPGVSLLAPVILDSFEQSSNVVTLGLRDGRVISARLAVAADGRGSTTRHLAGIKVHGWQYEQSGIICTIKHERSHKGIAHERFLPSGPLAILPLPGNYASIVWTETTSIAKYMMQLTDGQFKNEIALRVGDFLGSVDVVTPRSCYPLSLQQSDTYTSHRLALVGDAAHGMHPIAGQGLNLGFRDVAALAESVVDAARLGRDIGSMEILASYERWRRLDSSTLLALTDGLNRLFSNNIAPVKAARDIGLAAVNRIPPLKRLFMRYARGTLGNLPRLLKGQAL